MGQGNIFGRVGIGPKNKCWATATCVTMHIVKWYLIKYTVSQKRTPTLSIVGLSLKGINRFSILTIFDKYSWHNRPSNDDSSSHLTMHYTTWEKQHEGAITRQYYHFIKITRINHIWFTFRSLWLTVYHFISNCPVVQLPTVGLNVRNVGPLREHKHADGFSMPW